MYNLPKTSILGEDVFQPPEVGICEYCKCIGIIIDRRLNTQYGDPKSNMMTSCEFCFEEAWEMYEDQWREYYAGRL